MPTAHSSNSAPAVLTEPLTLTLSPEAMDALNAYRQAAHAYFHQRDALSPDKAALVDTAYAETGKELAGWLALDARSHLNEPIAFEL